MLRLWQKSPWKWVHQHLHDSVRTKRRVRVKVAQMHRIKEMIMGKHVRKVTLLVLPVTKRNCFTQSQCDWF